MHNIQYEIGDLIQYKVPVYYDDGTVKTYKTKKGHIFMIEITQEGLFCSKKGYSVRYKVKTDFDGVCFGWDYATQNTVTKIGEHHNKAKYSDEM